MNLNWFNVSSPAYVRDGRFFRLWNAFYRAFDPEWARRQGEPARQWGFGIVQIGGRHLLYVGHDSLFVGFVKVR